MANYNFKPADDITVLELAEILSIVGVYVEEEWLLNNCPDNLRRHWVEKEPVVIGAIPLESD